MALSIKTNTRRSCGQARGNLVPPSGQARATKGTRDRPLARPLPPPHLLKPWCELGANAVCRGVTTHGTKSAPPAQLLDLQGACATLITAGVMAPQISSGKYADSLAASTTTWLGLRAAGLVEGSGPAQPQDSSPPLRRAAGIGTRASELWLSPPVAICVLTSGGYEPL